MKHVLLVDDDPLILRIYKQGLARCGFQVQTAGDGLAAMNALRGGVPDLVVLDLMMPKLSGVEVLKFIRQQSDLAMLPVVVLSNAYLDQSAREAATLGAQKGLLKVSCTPALLADVIHEILGGSPAAADASHLLAAPLRDPSLEVRKSTPRDIPDAVPPVASSLAPSPSPQSHTAAKGADAELKEKVRIDFLTNAASTCSVLNRLLDAFINAPNEKERELRLQDLYRKVHFITAMAGMADCYQVAHMAAAFEALIFVIMNKPAQVNPSLMRTAQSIVGFFEELFEHARDRLPHARLESKVLVVDDDPLCNRLAVSALRNAQLQADSTIEPVAGLKLLQQQQYDLILLDVEMPGVNGFEFCRRMRILQNYLKIPVIFVTLHGDFLARAKTIESGADDLIAKPIHPMELAAKAVMHLLRNQLLRIPVPESSLGEPEQISGNFDRRVPVTEDAPAVDQSYSRTGRQVPRPSGNRPRVIEKHRERDSHAGPIVEPETRNEH